MTGRVQDVHLVVSPQAGCLPFLDAPEHVVRRAGVIAEKEFPMPCVQM